MTSLFFEKWWKYTVLSKSNMQKNLDGFGSMGQRNGSADPDTYQNVTDLQHFHTVGNVSWRIWRGKKVVSSSRAGGGRRGRYIGETSVWGLSIVETSRGLLHANIRSLSPLQYSIHSTRDTAMEQQSSVLKVTYHLSFIFKALTATVQNIENNNISYTALAYFPKVIPVCIFRAWVSRFTFSTLFYT